ncbi:hypothetical protein CMO92_04570 [Candidatus Woesearchaeota archaeon]|nr:hypothetical protein [Candidatus Woesearchaeota archaeon]
MVEPSTFRGTIEFFDKLGVYDVVLPFLLVFTIVYAIMEKSKVFGQEEVDGKTSTRKNLNSMTAFVIAFLVVASSQLVAVINQALANMVLLLLLSVCFLMLAGSFHEEKKEGFFLEGGWKTLFLVIMFVGIVLVFLDALGWLEWLWAYTLSSWDSTTFASFALLMIIVVFIFYITGGFSDIARSSTEKKSEGD